MQWLPVCPHCPPSGGQCSSPSASSVNSVSQAASPPPSLWWSRPVALSWTPDSAPWSLTRRKTAPPTLSSPLAPHGETALVAASALFSIYLSHHQASGRVYFAKYLCFYANFAKLYFSRYKGFMRKNGWKRLKVCIPGERQNKRDQCVETLIRWSLKFQKIQVKLVEIRGITEDKHTNKH